MSRVTKFPEKLANALAAKIKYFSPKNWLTR